MPIELVEYLEATQMSLTAALEFIVQLFIIVGCITLVFCLASIAWLSYRAARQPRLSQRQVARHTTRKESFMRRATT